MLLNQKPKPKPKKLSTTANEPTHLFHDPFELASNGEACVRGRDNALPWAVENLTLTLLFLKSLRAVFCQNKYQVVVMDRSRW